MMNETSIHEKVAALTTLAMEAMAAGNMEQAEAIQAQTAKLVEGQTA